MKQTKGIIGSRTEILSEAPSNTSVTLRQVLFYVPTKICPQSLQWTMFTFLLEFDICTFHLVENIRTDFSLYSYA